MVREISSEIDNVRQLLSGLSVEEREAILAEQLRSLPVESRAKVIGLAESGLTLVTGSLVSLNSDVAIILNTSEFDPETVFQALADFCRSERDKNSA
ncbi:hypothetical protein [Mastigocladopsis repens]|uniref:hypothetical protein n=1 Tax=Mastigocladopsis repens TaxID=221287 RepID=UPI000316991A|nr:hypothetical protein [Mastigocladopsis repens]